MWRPARSGQARFDREARRKLDLRRPPQFTINLRGVAPRFADTLRGRQLDLDIRHNLQSIYGVWRPARSGQARFDREARRKLDLRRPPQFTINLRGVAQLVARMVWDHEAQGSSPCTPTSLRQGFGWQASNIFVDL